MDRILGVTDSLVEIVSAETAIGRPTATARRLVDAFISANTRRTYAGALRRLDAWLYGRQLEDGSLSAYRHPELDRRRRPAQRRRPWPVRCCGASNRYGRDSLKARPTPQNYGEET